MITPDPEGYLHFSLSGRAYKLHPDRAEILLLIPRKELEQPAHWAPAALDWKQLPKYLRRELLRY